MIQQPWKLVTLPSFVGSQKLRWVCRRRGGAEDWDSPGLLLPAAGEPALAAGVGGLCDTHCPALGEELSCISAVCPDTDWAPSGFLPTMPILQGHPVLHWHRQAGHRPALETCRVDQSFSILCKDSGP